MANLSVYDPFDTRFNRRFNRFINHFFSDSPFAFEEPNGKQTLSFNINVSEDDKGYQVHADLPGVKKEDIRISVDGNQVSISAEVKGEKEEKNKNYICRERHEGSVYRSFTLGSNVDEAKAEAKFTDGVLELNLPKRSGNNGSKQVVVK